MSNGGSNLKHQPDTVWRLVEAHCKQITDALTAARVPFVLALTWAFVWAWAIYTVEWGYVHEYYRMTARADIQARLQLNKPFEARCLQANNAQLPADQQLTTLPPELLERCREVAKDQAKWGRTQGTEAHLVSFPGGFAKVTIADLGVVGQLGLLLILAWGYFAARREHFAIRAMLDVKGGDSRWMPRTFVLTPAERHLSAEHLAYAYHSVAQRFLFILTDKARPLPWTTVFLICFPALVATANFGTDVRDVMTRWEDVSALAVGGTIAEVILLGFIWPITIGLARLGFRTAVLLHGWRLAVRDVWMEEWDERNDDPASPVYVDTTGAKAVATTVSDEQRKAFNLEPRRAWA